MPGLPVAYGTGKSCSVSTQRSPDKDAKGGRREEVQRSGTRRRRPLLRAPRPRARRGPPGTSPSQHGGPDRTKGGGLWRAREPCWLGQAAKLRATTLPSAWEGISTATGIVTCPGSPWVPT